MKDRTRILIVYNLVLFAAVLLAWAVMVFFEREGMLSDLGLRNMKYFTVLSNVFEGIASLALAVCLVRVRRGRSARVPHGVFLLKFLAAVTVAVTFLVVALFFGPWIGWLPLYRGANFWFHLVVPVLAMAEFVLLDRFDGVAFRETLWAPLPALAYGIVYTVNLLVNGTGTDPDPNDFYGFVHWGFAVGFGIFAGILLVSWGAGCLLCLGNRAGRKEKSIDA